MELHELQIKLELTGGLETLFDNKKKYDLSLPTNDKVWTIQDLLQWMKINILTGDVTLFLRGEIVRPGIIVAVNDTDWELLGGMDYKIQPNDNIVFISSLHGG